MQNVENITELKNRVTTSYELKTENEKIDEKELDKECILQVLSLVDTRSTVYPPLGNPVSNLFIYPKELNLTCCKNQIKVKNVFVEFNIRESLNSSFIPVFYSRYGNVCMVDTESCKIVPKSQHPQFSEEIKALLPMNISGDLHLVVSIYTIDTKNLFKESKSKKLPKYLLGYSWIKLSLNSNDFSVDREISVPAVISLPQNYLNYDLETINPSNTSDLKWLDGSGKPILKIDLKYQSNIHCFDVTFKKLVELTENLPVNSKNVESYLKLIKLCHVISDSEIWNGYHVIFQTLTNILLASEKLNMNNANELDLVKLTVGLIIHIVNKMTLHGYSEVLNIFVKDHINVYDKSYIHDQLLRGLFEILQIDPKKMDITFQNSWFYLSIFLKSFKKMVLHSAKYKVNNREGLLKTKSEEYLEWFLITATKYIYNKSDKSLQKAMQINLEISEFICELLNLLNRNFVIKLISFIYERYKNYSTTLKYFSEIRYQFLNCICQHEFFVNINVPILLTQKTGFNNSYCFSLTPKFRNNHFIASIIVEEVQKSLTEDLQTIDYSCGFLKSLILKHYYDDRYNSKDLNCLSNVMLLYFPFLTVLMENGQLLTYQFADGFSNKNDDVFSLNSKANNATSGSMTSQSKFATLSKQNSVSLNTFQSMDSCKNINEQNIRDLLFCFLLVLESVNRDMLTSWWNNINQMNLKIPVYVKQNYTQFYGEKCTNKQSHYIEFLRLLQACLEIFKYNKSSNNKKESYIDSFKKSSFKNVNNRSSLLLTKNLPSIDQLSSMVTYDEIFEEEVLIIVMDILEFFCASQKVF